MSAPTPIQAGNLSAANIPHGFFTRAGGVSTGIYQALNCGYGSNDDRAAVRENRARVAASLDVDAGSLITIHQIHSADAITVTSPWTPDKAPRGDGMVTDRRGIALGVLAADCAPVLFADAEAGVIGAAHAGWRGALAGILGATVDAMTALGARRGAIAAAFGPCIGQPSYEFGPEFHAAFADAGVANGAYFLPAVRDGHYQFDLPGFVRDQLAALDLASIDMRAVDTYAAPDRFYSYRRATHRNEPDYGRQISAIALV